MILWAVFSLAGRGGRIWAVIWFRSGTPAEYPCAARDMPTAFIASIGVEKVRFNVANALSIAYA